MECDPDPGPIGGDLNRDLDGSTRFSKTIPVATTSPSRTTRPNVDKDGVQLVSRQNGKATVVQGSSRRSALVSQFVFDYRQSGFVWRSCDEKGKRRIDGPRLIPAINSSVGAKESFCGKGGDVVEHNRVVAGGSVMKWAGVEDGIASNTHYIGDLEMGSEWGCSTSTDYHEFCNDERNLVLNGRVYIEDSDLGFVSDDFEDVNRKDNEMCLRNMEVLENVLPVAVDRSDFISENWVKENVVNVAFILRVKFGINKAKGEDLIVALVDDTEEEHSGGERASVVHRSPSYWKGEKELRNLVCTVNYDGLCSGSRDSEGGRSGGRRRREAC